MLSSLIKNTKPLVLLHMIWLSGCAFCAEKSDIMVEKRLNPVAYFVDRTEPTKDILQSLSLHKTVSLVGVTSIGKTEIARNYALTNREKYELIWFFDASLDLNEQFVLLAKKINETLLAESKNKLSEEPNKAQKEAMEFLTQRKNWLLVFDNLRLNQNQKIAPIINWNHDGHIIICAQDAVTLPNNIYIHELDKENGMKLLQKILGNDQVSQELLEKLVEIFKGYPGPIVQGALLLKEHKYLSIDEYKNILMKSSNPVKKHMELVLNLLNDNDKKLLRTIAVLNNQNFSKNLLNILLGNDGYIAEGLQHLSQFGLIKNTENKDNTNLFEMHDAIKEGVLELATEKEIEEELTKVIGALNSLMQRGEMSRYGFITSDATIKSNLEVLLDNAEKYNVDVYVVLELRKNLAGYYMSLLDYYNMEKMKNWLEDKKISKSLDGKKMTNPQKISYSGYLTNIGIYEHFAKGKFVSALSYFSKARDMIKDIKEAIWLEAAILLEIAQAQVYSGDIINAEKELEQYRALVEKNKQDINSKDNKFDEGGYWFIKTRVLLSKRQYQEALAAIDNTVKLVLDLSKEQLVPDPTTTIPCYVVKSEVLNYMEKFKDSYDIIKQAAKESMPDGQAVHELHARILVQLSRAELGLGMVDEALEHAATACDIFQKEMDKYNITAVTNPEFATALVAKGDALFKKNRFDESLTAYNEAEAIYFRTYGNNYSRMDDVSYLLSQGSKAACIGKNQFWKKHFYDQMLANFAKDHPRVVDTMAVCEKFK